MAWSAPMTAVANTIFTAAQFNQFVRDDLNETAPAKATAAGRFFVTTGANAITERVVDGQIITTAETTTSTSYTDLTTPGPTITVTTGTRAFVIHGCRMDNNTNLAACEMGYTVSGASTLPVAQSALVRSVSNTAGDSYEFTWGRLREDLTAGSNTFTAQYRVSAGTGTFQLRSLTVIPF